MIIVVFFAKMPASESWRYYTPRARGRDGWVGGQ